MTHPTVKKRFFATFIANLLRGACIFLSGLLIARSLGPARFGDYNFLLGSFAAIFQILDMGTSTAFYTLMSKRERNRAFVWMYLGWQFFQFFFTAFVLYFFLPASWLDKFWVGHERHIILLAFATLFIKQQVWSTFAQVGESKRLTYLVQIMSVMVAAVYLASIALLWRLNHLSLIAIYVVTIFEYGIASIFGGLLLVKGIPKNDPGFGYRKVLKEYLPCCVPLILYSFVGFFYSYADNWLLQHYGGAKQQGYYQIASQFSSVGLVMSLALFQIVWKELAEALERNDMARIASIYRKASRFTFTAIAVFAGFLVPWSAEITKMSLGSAYAGGVLSTAVMFIYPVHQGLNYIVNAFFFATSRMRAQVTIATFFSIVSIACSYFIQAPSTAWLPGWGLGSLGMSVKSVVLNVIFTNIGVWWIARIGKWKFDWFYQIPVLLGTVGISFLVKQVFLKSSISWLPSPSIISIGFCFCIYFTIAAGALFFFPGLVGLSRAELKNYRHKIFGLFCPR